MGEFLVFIKWLKCKKIWLVSGCLNFNKIINFLNNKKRILYFSAKKNARRKKKI